MFCLLIIESASKRSLKLLGYLGVYWRSKHLRRNNFRIVFIFTVNCLQSSKWDKLVIASGREL